MHAFSWQMGEPTANAILILFLYFFSSQVLEAFLAEGSELWMFNEVPEKERERKLTDGGLDISGLANIKLVHREGNAVIRRHLESLPLETFDSVSSVSSPTLWKQTDISSQMLGMEVMCLRSIKKYKHQQSTAILHHCPSHFTTIPNMSLVVDMVVLKGWERERAILLHLFVSVSENLHGNTPPIWLHAYLVEKPTRTLLTN